MTNKSNIHLHDSIIELSILTFLKEAVQKNKISPHKQGEYLIYYFFVALIQFGMIMMMVLAISNNHGDYTLYATEYYTVLVIKFLSSCALHLMLYPEVARTMKMMKFILNHEEQFTNPNLAFLISFTAHHINLFAEFLNVYMLLF